MEHALAQHFEKSARGLAQSKSWRLLDPATNFAERFGLRQSSGAFESVAEMGKVNKIHVGE